MSNLKAAIKHINSHDRCVMHNGIKFDKYVIENLVGKITIPIEDTLLISKLMYTKDELFDIDRGIEAMPGKLKGGYSLGAFGFRFGDFKLNFEDFSRLTGDMITYCKQDVDLTWRLYKHMRGMPNFPKREVLDFEYKVADIIQQQELHGFYYDQEAARTHMTNLRFRKTSLELKLQKIFRPKFLPDGPIKKTKKKIKRKEYIVDNDYSFKCKVPLRFIHPLPRLKRTREDEFGNIFPVYKIPGKNKFKWFDKPHRIYYKVQDGEYQPIKYQKFNPGSRDQIKLWLKHDYDFEFSTLTEKGSRKVDNDELIKALGDNGEALSQYLKVTKDLSEVVGVLEEYKPNTGSIHGRVDTIGAATHRCTHSAPNVAQTSADPIFRSFYTTPKGYTLVGADLANIEIRVLAHYLAEYDDGKYARAVLSKDMHW